MPPVAATAPLQLGAHGNETRDQGLDQHAADEGVRGFAQEDPDQSRRLLPLGAAGRPPHVFDDVIGRRAGWRLVRAQHEPRQDVVAAGDPAERADRAG